MSSKDAKKEPPEVTEFQKELHGLFESRTASKSKVDKLTKLALHSARYYKNIVYCLEKFITRCVPEYKLTGLYVLDSICRTSKSIKQKSSSSSFTGSEYVGRFERNIEALFAEFCKVQEDKEKEKVKRVVDLWERSGTFTPSVTEKIKKKYFPLLETAGGAAADSEEVTAEGAEENATEKAASIISSLAASLGQGHTSDFTRSPLASATPASSSSSNPATPSTTDGSAGTPTSSVFISQTPQPIPSTGTFGNQLSGTFNNNIHSKPADNTLLAGLSDPSSAQALQTLLATISQVNAAAAASLPTTGGGQANHQASSLLAPAPMPGFQGPGSQDLPPVLQQLQGVLANSNQNGAFLPNNNTMVSSTVASSSFLHSDPRAGSGSVGESSSAGPASMSIVHHQREYSGNGLGGGLLPTGLAPRDPRSAPVDPRLAFQQQQQQQQQGAGGLGHTQPPGSQPPQAQPLPPSQQSQAQTQGQGQGQALDPRTMAHLASFLNPASPMDGAMSSRLPPGPPHVPMSMPMSMHMSMHGQPFPPRSSQGSQEGVGQGQGQGQGQGHGHGGQGQAIRRDLHLLPNRPGSTQESFLSRQGEFKGDRSSRPADNTGFDPPEVKEDPAVGADKIRVISRTLWVGGTFIPTISEQELEAIFAPKGQIATLIINQAKFNAFIKMADRTHAERCKVELDRTMVQGEVMKVGWGCGFGPRDCFDYTSGESIIPVDRLTDTDRRWLGQSIVGGFGVHEPIRGGVCIYEPNIEPVGSDGREALPRRGGGGGPGGMAAGRGGRGGGGVGGPGGFAGRGRGRGFGQMDQQDGAGGSSRGRGGMMMNMGRGRGAGADEQHEHRIHPLPHRPPVAAGAAAAAAAGTGQGAGAGAGGMRGWAGKRDFPQGAGQDMSVLMGHSGGPFPQVSHPSSQDEEGGPRRNKKSRWE